MHIITFFILLCAIDTIYLGNASTVDDEKAANTAVISYYQLDLKRWNSEGLEIKFKLGIADSANYICRDPALCGMNYTTPFYASNVYLDGDPIQRKAYFEVRFYIRYPNDTVLLQTTSTKYVLSKYLVEDIVLDGRKNLQLDGIYEIVKIGDAVYYKSPDSDLNVALIPVACCLLIVVIIMAVSLHCWSKKRSQEDGRAKRMEMKKKHKVGPSPHISPEHSRPPGQPKHGQFYYPDDRNLNTDQRDYKGNAAAAKLPPLGANQVDPEPSPPNSDINNDALINEKKKHRRHKKSKKSRQQNFENPTFTAEGAGGAGQTEGSAAMVAPPTSQQNITAEEKKTNLQGSGSDNEKPAYNFINEV